MVQPARHKTFIKKILGSKVFLFLTALSLIWLLIGLGRESYRKYQLTREINALKSEIARLDGNNQELNNLIKYFQEESYLEKEARLKLNLKKPDEKVVVAPKEGLFEQADDSDIGSSVLADEQFFSEKDIFQSRASADSMQLKTGISNWWKWWEYFFARE